MFVFLATLIKKAGDSGRRVKSPLRLPGIILLLILLPNLWCHIAWAQPGHLVMKPDAHTVQVTGQVLSSEGDLLTNVTVQVKGTKLGLLTDADGRFSMELPEGQDRRTLIFSYIGYKEQEIDLTTVHIKNSKVHLRVILIPGKDNQMEDVQVLGRSANELANRQSYNVTAIDAQKLHNSTLDIAQALDRVSGVRVRESGGVGSDFNFSLNGFSGGRVKFFIDGIPMDNLGSSFQINNIPVNLAERVEVYKGVVPIWLGSDALGGAVNIITGNKKANYLDVSYSFGSFNTHKTNLAAALTSKNGFSVQVNAYQNYSDNDYKVTLDVADIHTGAYTPNATVRRFHDKYHNEMAIVNLGFLDKKWADKLLVGVSVGKSYKQIQTGARMVSVFGAYHTRGNILMPSLKYEKKDLVRGLDVKLNANYNFGKETSIDTLNRRYDWYGNYKQYEGAGGERSRSYFEFGNNIGIATASLKYHLAGNHELALNNVFTHFNRNTSNLLLEGSDVYYQPQKTDKNVLGLSYQYDFAKKGSITLMGKGLHQHAYTRLSYNPSGNWGDVAYKDVAANTDKIGYAVAMSYYLSPQFETKLSYEKANRLPDNEELFGDMVNQESNFDLKPESSQNFNLGFIYNFNVSQAHRFLITASGIYRYSTNYIYNIFNNNQTKLVAANLDGVRNLGAEAELRYSFKKLLAAGFSATYQDLRNMQKYEPDYEAVSVVYKDRLRNVPYLFGNADASLFFHNVFAKSDHLTIGYNLLYVHAFYLYWPSRGSQEKKYGIPMQISHDANIVYSFKNGQYNVALEGHNLADRLLYDNFSLQKPGRSFSIKFRYFINRK